MMNAYQWNRFVWDHKPQLIDQIRRQLPALRFDNLRQGFAPHFVRLQRRLDDVDLDLDTVLVRLDGDSRVARAEVVDLRD